MYKEHIVTLIRVGWFTRIWFISSAEQVNRSSVEDFLKQGKRPQLYLSKFSTLLQITVLCGVFTSRRKREKNAKRVKCLNTKTLMFPINVFQSKVGISTNSLHRDKIQ